jgi:hypothetical protein
MVSVCKIVNGEIKWANPVSDGGIVSREERVRDGLFKARRFIEGIRIGAEEAGAYVGGDTQYTMWIQIGVAEFRIRETLPDGSTRWMDGRP